MTFNLTLVLRKHNCWLSEKIISMSVWYDFRAWILPSFLHNFFQYFLFLFSIDIIKRQTWYCVCVLCYHPGGSQWSLHCLVGRWGTRCCHPAAADTCQWLPVCQHISSRHNLLTMPVSCYICGRDFGTKSITIHIPNCIKKWENEQKKLPKSQRRPPPSAPVNLDKVISGELKGEELNKFNGEVLQEWNDTALVPCGHCGRFKTLSLYNVINFTETIYIPGHFCQVLLTYIRKAAQVIIQWQRRAQKMNPIHPELVLKSVIQSWNQRRKHLEVMRMDLIFRMKVLTLVKRTLSGSYNRVKF